MQQYDFTAAANKTFPLASAGRYIKYLSGNNGGGDVSIVVTPSGQGATKVVLVPGQAFRVSDAGPTPSGWVLSNNAGGATINGTVVVGDGRIDDPTINGTVQIVDGSKARTLSNNAYAAYVLQNAAAAVYAQIQLWNPATSGVRLVVESISNMLSTANGNAFVVSSVAQLATIYEQGQPKLLGGTASVASVCAGTTAAAPGVPELMSFAITGNQPQSFTPNEPIVVPPGYGLLLWGNVVNNSLSAIFEWYEEPNK